jgi:hypothetical protein
MIDNKLKMFAETFWKSYRRGWCDILMTEEKYLSDCFDNDERKLQAKLIRQLVEEFQYYHTGDGEDMVVDSRKLLDFADVLEKSTK